MKLMALAPYLTRKLDDLTVDDFAKIKDGLGVDIDLHPEIINAGVALMQGQNINTVADLIQSPAAIQSLLTMLKKPARDEQLMVVEQCPHCEKMFLRNA